MIKGKNIIKYQKKSNFTLGKFFILYSSFNFTFIAIILLLDTFKLPLYYLSKIRIFFLSLYETLKDIQLFIKDLI